MAGLRRRGREWFSLACALYGPRPHARSPRASALRPGWSSKLKWDVIRAVRSTPVAAQAGRSFHESAAEAQC
jgi:hypothetical protein